MVKVVFLITFVLFWAYIGVRGVCFGFYLQNLMSRRVKNPVRYVDWGRTENVYHYSGLFDWNFKSMLRYEGDYD